MAIKNYSDWNGETVQLNGNLYGMNPVAFKEKFPGVKGIKQNCHLLSDLWVGEYNQAVWNAEIGKYDRDVRPVTRMVTYKSNPSKHVCDARCVNARGRTMNCECSCGGKNHGKGSTLSCD